MIALWEPNCTLTPLPCFLIYFTYNSAKYDDEHDYRAPSTTKLPMVRMPQLLGFHLIGYVCGVDVSKVCE